MTTSRRFPRKPAHRPALVAVILLFAVTAAGCGGSDSKEAGGGGDKTVTISNLEFSPDTLRVKVGDTVTVVNKDSAEHTVTATDNSFDTGRFASGTKTFTVTKAGRFEYVCLVHPFMAHKFIQVS